MVEAVKEYGLIYKTEQRAKLDWAKHAQTQLELMTEMFLDHEELIQTYNSIRGVKRIIFGLGLDLGYWGNHPKERAYL